MTGTKFLITGATGGAASAQLLEKGQRVRAFVHSEDERSEGLRRRGAEVVVQATAEFAQAALEAGVDAIATCRRFQRGPMRRAIRPSSTGWRGGFSTGRVSISPIYDQPISRSGCFT
jgi:uncharacterized protein YbjT (DUF2867 family)